MIYKISMTKNKRKAETRKSFKAKKSRKKNKQKPIKNIISKHPFYDLMIADIIKKL